MKEESLLLKRWIQKKNLNIKKNVNKILCKEMWISNDFLRLNLNLICKVSYENLQSSFNWSTLSICT